MTNTLLSRPDSLVAHWRTSAEGNPAGPLFSNDYAEFDLTAQAIWYNTGHSLCSGSSTVQCC